MSHLESFSKYSKKSGKTVSVSFFDSPVGKIIAAADEDNLLLVSFEDSKNFEKKLKAMTDSEDMQFIEKKNKLLVQFESELTAYFDGKLKKFTVPVRTFGSSFQKDVWNKLQELPYGSTQTYSDLAKAIGRAASHSRAVGAACGANAHLLVIPCHRLVASASKGGFSSGVDRKEWLLIHEKKHAPTRKRKLSG